AWGLALRKRFCRSFNFELQASADDNGIVLSLGPQHSFPIEQMFGMLNRGNARELLVQALLAVPMFGVRWRWNATRALLVLRQRGGRKVPPPLQRFRADDLLTQVFPAQTACLENVVGDIEVPDHPLVNQTVHDCLTEAMDVDRWLALIDAIEARSVELVAKDTREPSPFSHQILNANPYAFLDDAPLEERRARAVATRRTLSVEDLGDIGQLDPAAIELVRSEAWPLVRDADELHDTLLSLAVLPAEDGPPWSGYFDELLAAGRAAELAPPDGPRLWVAAERLSLARAAYPGAVARPELSLPEALSQPAEAIEAYQAIVRGRLEAVGPVTAEKIAADLGLRPAAVAAALEALEGAGAVLRGRYTAAADGVEWCERRLLARIHRLSLAQARRQVQPVDVADFWRFLLVHQHAAPDWQWQGRGGLREVIAQLQGFEAPAGAWERDLLSGRVQDYESGWLDELSLAGEVVWGRLQPPKRPDDGPPSMSGLSRLVPISIVARGDVAWLLPAGRAGSANNARSNARLVFETLQGQGALFVQDLAALTGLLPAQLEEALGELAYLGLVSADGFAPIRRIAGGDRHRAWPPMRRVKRPARGMRSGGGGRWWQFPGRVADVASGERLEQWARQLLRRYGVMFRDLLTRESAAPAWRELVAVYRRWEAQGRIRGGRFVGGVGGEQYAEPSVIDELRRVRQSDASRQWVVVSAADPLNLAGILTAGPRIAAKPRNSLAIRDGQLIAWQEAGQVHFVESLPPVPAEQVARALRVPAAVRAADAAGRAIERLTVNEGAPAQDATGAAVQ
ncbi:MAG: DEAD/DEAH box helicase, partial [Pirellulales bacterium]